MKWKPKLLLSEQWLLRSAESLVDCPSTSPAWQWPSWPWSYSGSSDHRDSWRGGETFSKPPTQWVKIKTEEKEEWNKYWCRFLFSSGNPVSVSDATPTAIIAILLFIFPAKSIFFRQLFDSSINGGKFLSSPALIDWKTVLYRLPWGIILLLGDTFSWAFWSYIFSVKKVVTHAGSSYFSIGGGYALAEGSEQSCLSYWIGQQLTGLGDLDDWVLLLVVSIIMMLVTQLVSNSAAAAMIIPILKVLALTLQVIPFAS